jgi:hypothetical protein
MNNILSCELCRKWSIPNDVRLNLHARKFRKEKQKKSWIYTWARWNLIDCVLLYFLRLEKYCCWSLCKIHGLSSVVVRGEERRCCCIFIWHMKTNVFILFTTTTKFGHDYLIGSRTVSRFSFSHLSLFKCENNILTTKKRKKETRQWSSFFTR